MANTTKPSKKPAPDAERSGDTLGTYIRDKLSGQPVTKGQNVQLPLGFGFMSASSQSVPIKIASTDPDGTVVVTDSTEFQVSQKPAEQIKDAAPSTGDGPAAS